MRSKLLLTAALVGLSTQRPGYSEDIGMKAFYYSSAAYCAYETI